MELLLAFAVLLLLGVLMSGLAHRTVLSTAVMFLVGGFVLGRGGLDLLGLRPTDPLVTRLADLALFTVLFTDGMDNPVRDLRTAWRLPGRVLALGMPLTFVGLAVLARVLIGVSWTASLLVAAVLSPTDPVFAAAIVGREGIPPRLRHLLNVESGLNDGLALPAVIALLAISGSGNAQPFRLVLELAGGLALGIAVPLLVVSLERSRAFGASRAYEPLIGVAIALVVFAVADATGANRYLAAFAAGTTMTSMSGTTAQTFLRFGKPLAELLKLAALLVFGALISTSVLFEDGAAGVLFAVLALAVARPIGILLALFGSDLARRECLAAAWFGPKGFASVVYGLLVLRAHVPESLRLFHLIALVVSLSIVLHSTTDVLIARQFADPAPEPHATRI